MYVLIGENGDYNTIESQFIGVFDDVEKAVNAKKLSLTKSAQSGYKCKL